MQINTLINVLVLFHIRTRLLKLLLPSYVFCHRVFLLFYTRTFFIRREIEEEIMASLHELVTLGDCVGIVAKLKAEIGKARNVPLVNEKVEGSAVRQYL